MNAALVQQGQIKKKKEKMSEVKKKKCGHPKPAAQAASVCQTQTRQRDGSYSAISSEDLQILNL